MAGKKLFVGSLPAGISPAALRDEFGRYGQVEDVFVKQGCEPTKQWAFITLASAEEAQRAKEATDRILHIPGAERPCDVMVAKNQGMAGHDPIAQPMGSPAPAAVASHLVGAYGGAAQQLPEAPKKVFVGSLPDGIGVADLRAEFGRYGQIVDVHLNNKPVEAGRQWAFITFVSPEQAQMAKVSTDRLLKFLGSEKACEVTLARHQGMFGKEALHDGGAPQAQAVFLEAQPQLAAGGSVYGTPAVAATGGQGGLRKIFVGSLPQGIGQEHLNAEFSRYGQVVDIHLNNKACEPGRNWAFITYASQEQAAYAKDATDRVLMFPGADRACEVMVAKNQGKFGQDAISNAPIQTITNPAYLAAAPQAAQAQPQPAAGGYYAAPEGGMRKIFVGSLPQQIGQEHLTAEFSRYGQVVDIHINNKPCEPGRNWAFITFASQEQASYAKDATDRVLMFPGADRACEVMVAKNQGKFGQDAVSNAPIQTITNPAYAAAAPQVAQAAAAQPPPPPTPPPQHLTPWRMYKTAAGLPYYHNHATAVTQWECPADLQVPGQPTAYAAVAAAPQVRYAPY